MNQTDISSLTDDELWDRMKSLSRAERSALSDFVEHLAEIDERKLHSERGFGSLFEYCVHCLGCSEAAAYRRIRGARAIRLYPAIRPMLRDGRLTLESVVLLHPFLEDSDAAALVQKACGLRNYQVQTLIAGRQPDAPRRDVIRFCSPAQPLNATVTRPEDSLLAFVESASAPTPSKPPVPQAPQSEPQPRPSHSVRIAFTADAEFHQLMLRARALLRHKYPDGRLEGVLKDALVSLLKRRDRSFRWRTPAA
jgi:hypothetical protein